MAAGPWNLPFQGARRPVSPVPAVPVEVLVPGNSCPEDQLGETILLRSSERLEHRGKRLFSVEIAWPQKSPAIAPRKQVLLDLAGYFDAHPEHESVEFSVSADRCTPR